MDKSLRFRGKLGAGFGSYGWSGEAPKVISTSLEKSGLKVSLEPLGIKYRPSGEELAECAAFGEKFAKAMKE